MAIVKRLTVEGYWTGCLICVYYIHRTSHRSKLHRKEIQVALENKNLDIDGLDCDRKGYCVGYDYEEVYIDSIENVYFKFKSVDEITANTVKITGTATALISATCSFFDIDNSIWDSEEKNMFTLRGLVCMKNMNLNLSVSLYLIVNKLEDEGIFLELKTVDFDLTLNQVHE